MVDKEKSAGVVAEELSLSELKIYAAFIQDLLAQRKAEQNAIINK